MSLQYHVAIASISNSPPLTAEPAPDVFDGIGIVCDCSFVVTIVFKSPEVLVTVAEIFIPLNYLSD